MKNIIFCDIEANIKTKKINEIGLVYKFNELKTTSIEESCAFILSCNTNFISGHNFIDFDLIWLGLAWLGFGQGLTARCRHQRIGSNRADTDCLEPEGSADSQQKKRRSGPLAAWQCMRAFAFQKLQCVPAARHQALQASVECLERHARQGAK